MMEVKEITDNSEVFVFKESGLEKIENSAELGRIALDFCNYSTNSEKILPKENFIGAGINSIVWEAEDIAIKLSSRTSGNKFRRGATNKPENLLDQFEFLDYFKKYLEYKSDGTICTPDQYFAIRNQKGEFLKAEELMTDWSTVVEISQSHNLDEHEHALFLEQTKNKINEQIGSPIIKLGLSDSGVGKNKILHGGNILMPKDTVDLDNPKICIIDQPAIGIKGKLAVSIIKQINSAGLKS